MPVVRDFILADERSSGLEGGLLRKTQTEEKKERKKKKKREKKRRGRLRKTGGWVRREGHFSGTDKEEDLGVKLLRGRENLPVKKEEQRRSRSELSGKFILNLVCVLLLMPCFIFY